VTACEREAWRLAYLAEGLKVSRGTVHPDKVWKWAKSMSLIAEQFAPNDDDEPADSENVSV
jgi:hypothetical protein